MTQRRDPLTAFQASSSTPTAPCSTSLPPRARSPTSAGSPRPAGPLSRDKQLQYRLAPHTENRCADFSQVAAARFNFSLEASIFRRPLLHIGLMDPALGLGPFPEVPAVLAFCAKQVRTGFLQWLADNAGSAGQALGPRGDFEAQSCPPTRSRLPDPAPTSINMRFRFARPRRRARCIAMLRRLGRAGRPISACGSSRRTPMASAAAPPGAPDFGIRTLAELPALLGRGPS